MSLLSNITNEFQTYFVNARFQIPFILGIICLVWIFNFINWYVLKHNLTRFGLLPHSIPHLFTGMFMSPILHGNFNHLFFNSIPFFALGLLICGIGRETFIVVTVFTGIIENLCVWLFGRRYLHIGASGIISGYFGFLLGIAYIAPSFMTIIIALVVFYYFGSIIAGLFPIEEGSSWESHLSGFISGLLIMYLLFNKPEFRQWAFSWL